MSDTEQVVSDKEISATEKKRLRKNEINRKSYHKRKMKDPTLLPRKAKRQMSDTEQVVSDKEISATEKKRLRKNEINRKSYHKRKIKDPTLLPRKAKRQRERRGNYKLIKGSVKDKPSIASTLASQEEISATEKKRLRKNAINRKSYHKRKIKDPTLLSRKAKRQRESYKLIKAFLKDKPSIASALAS